MPSSAGRTIIDQLTGQEITFVETAADSAGVREVSRVQIPAQTAGPPPHRHTRFTETFAVEAGELTVRVDGETRPCAAGESVTIRRGQVHTFANTSGQPATFVCTIEPAWQFESGIRAMTEISNAAGRPPRNPLVVLAILDRLDAKLPVVPLFVQRALTALLVPFGRRALARRGL